MKHVNKTIQEALLKNNILTKDEWHTAMQEAQATGELAHHHLIQKGVLTEKQLLIALSQTFNLEKINLKSIPIDDAAIAKVPVKFAWYYRIMPVNFEKNILTIASALPLDIKTEDDIRMHLGVDIKVTLTEESDLLDALKKYYGFASDTIDRIMTKDPKKNASKDDSANWIEDLEKKSEDPTVSNLVNQIILEAYKNRATDIHIEPYRDKVRFRYRIDGVLVDANLPENVKYFLAPILSRIKIMANLSITEKRLPQDGSAVVKTKDQQIDLRISTMPTPRGESMVIRILPTKVILLSLEKLGFNEEDIQMFRDLIERPHGIIFITGPTGSGKTTTLYACLNEIKSDQRKIITVEDPVEYEVEGITQVQVAPKVNFTFATGLRSLLRHDPDIIMVGEVRDLETAEIAIRTALTGHLVFSTLHTNDSASGVTRLIDMGLEPYLVASSVQAFVAQRLIRVICNRCKEEVKNPIAGVIEEIAQSLNLPSTEGLKIYQGKGCDHCNYTGYYGRRAIYEILIMTESLRAAVLDKPRSDHIKKMARLQGLRTLRQSGWQAVLQGLTTPNEVMNVTTKDDDLDPPKSYETNLELTEDNVESLPRPRDFRPTTNQKGSVWSTSSGHAYEYRAYQRSSEPVKIHYQVVKRDPIKLNNLIADGVEVETVTENISAAGIKFVSKVFFSIGTLLELKINLGSGNKSIECLAKVCRVEENNAQNLYYVMVCYLDIPSADRFAINKFVERSLPSSERIELPRK